MANSFLMKDRAGRVAGYILSGNQGVICRVEAMKEGKVKLVVLDEEGLISSYEIDADGNEHQILTEVNAISGAYVVCADEVYCATSEKAWRMQNRRKKEKAEKTAEQKELIENHEKQEIKGFARSLQNEMRWPRPACWSAAIYRDGHWQEDEV